MKVIGAVAKPLCQRRGGNQRSDPSAAVRESRAEEDAEDCGTRLCRLVLRAAAQLPPEWTSVDTRRLKKRPKTFSKPALRRAIRSTRRHSRCFSGSGKRYPSSSRRAAARDVGTVDFQGGRGWLHRRGGNRYHPGSAPLDCPSSAAWCWVNSANRLLAAIDTDIAGERSHARTLDADTTGVLRDIHRRVGTTILFESSGGQVHKVAHLPELRFALGEPEVDTTSVDTAAVALEAKAFFIQRVARTASRSTIRPRSTRRFTTAGHPSTKMTRSSPRFARWSERDQTGREHPCRAVPGRQQHGAGLTTANASRT